MPTRLNEHDQMLRLITEADWQRQVEHTATLLGWRVFHAPDNRPIVAKSGRRYVQSVRAGWPDLIAVRGGRMLALELKREGPKACCTPDQLEWLLALAASGAEVGFVRPSDGDLVRSVLRGEAWMPRPVNGVPYGAEGLRVEA